jgi:peptidoglycan/xylan/chitin deacetylase (PgdA/CDA1 family)
MKSSVSLPLVGAATLAASGALLCATVRRQPRWLAKLLAARSDTVLFGANTSQRQVALTFDDGPHPVLTRALMDVLDRHGARATFFLLGERVVECPEMARSLVARGHEVGNHMWDDRPSILLSRKSFRRDMLRTHERLVAVGASPHFFRPGSGWFRPSDLALLREYGYRLALGTVSVMDLDVCDPERWMRFVSARIQPGAIVVLHEGLERRARVVALTDGLLTILRERGYRFVTLGELFDPAYRT